MSNDMEKLSDFSEVQENRGSTIITNLQGDMPAELKVNDVITVDNMQEKMQKTLQEKLEVVFNKLAVMNESILRAKEELIDLENIFNELHEKFSSKMSTPDNK